MLYPNKEQLKNSVTNHLLFSEGFVYNDKLTVYPITMKHFAELQLYQTAITVNKNSKFPLIEIIKMSYLDFLMYLYSMPEIGEQYGEKDCKLYFAFAFNLFLLACRLDKTQLRIDNSGIYLNDFLIDSDVFDDLRRIIFIQNDIDCDIDDFINYNTEQKFKQKDITDKNSSTIEDYIDSLAICTYLKEDDIKHLPVRKFWRYINRINMYDTYKISKTGEAGGMVKYKHPIQHWMVKIDNDKYKDKILNEKEYMDKIG